MSQESWRVVEVFEAYFAICSERIVDLEYLLEMAYRWDWKERRWSW